MFRQIGRFAFVAGAGLAVAVSTFAATAHEPAGAARLAAADAGPLSCEIAVSAGAGGVTIEPVVHATRAVSGTYELRVTGGGRAGRSDVGQGGAFEVAAGQSEASLGSVMLGGSGRYRAEMTVTAGDRTVSCAADVTL